MRHIVVALGLFLLPAVALAGPHVDEGAATEDLRQRLGADGPRWKLLVVDVQDDPTSRQVVVVSDDGIGMPEQPSRQSGHTNLAERARMTRGSFWVAAHPDGGTTVEWRSPIDL